MGRASRRASDDGRRPGTTAAAEARPEAILVALDAKAKDDGSRQGIIMGRLRGCCVSLAVGVTLVVIAGARARQDDLRVHLRNIADAAGMHFVHHDAPTPGKYFVQSAPGGVAVFDYNGDGRPDIFFTNGALAPSLQKTSAVYSNRLYRNDGNMRFTDVTDIAGVRGVGYAMGAAAADYDNDGRVDLFVAGVRQ